MAGYIEKRRNRYYALTEVPPSLREAMAKSRFCRSLQTGDRAIANSRKWAVFAEFNAQIEAARVVQTGDAEKDEARTLRAALRNASQADEEGIRDHIATRSHEIRGGPVGEASGIPPDELEYEPEREIRADAYYLLATGQATPLDEHLEQWLREVPYTERTKGDHRRAVQRLKEWPAGKVETLEAVTQRKAGEFVSWLLQPRRPEWTGSHKTAAKYKSSLLSYWRFLKGKGLVESNPWAAQTIAKPKANLEGTETQERSFTDDEVRTLLAGPADQMTADLMRMAALSGMRIDELCRLTVSTVEAGVFKITKAKTKAGVRAVPIHPDLKAIVAKRCEGKAKCAFLFDELSGKSLERSMPAVKRFGRYMRFVKVAVIIADKRRSLVNFHSFRRWFITQAERAGQAKTTIEAVVGHKREGESFGRYSDGPGEALHRKCVEAVKLPPLPKSPSPATATATAAPRKRKASSNGF